MHLEIIAVWDYSANLSCYLRAALRAVEVGAAGIVVSNHGARQLDYSPATINVLEEVVNSFLYFLHIYITQNNCLHESNCYNQPKSTPSWAPVTIWS